MNHYGDFCEGFARLIHKVDAWFAFWASDSLPVQVEPGQVRGGEAHEHVAVGVVFHGGAFDGAVGVVLYHPLARVFVEHENGHGVAGLHDLLCFGVYGSERHLHGDLGGRALGEVFDGPARGIQQGDAREPAGDEGAFPGHAVARVAVCQKFAGKECQGVIVAGVAVDDFAGHGPGAAHHVRGRGAVRGCVADAELHGRGRFGLVRSAECHLFFVAGEVDRGHVGGAPVHGHGRGGDGFGGAVCAHHGGGCGV